MAARGQFDHGADKVFNGLAGLGEDGLGGVVDLGAGDLQFALGGDEGDHDLGDRGDACGFFGGDGAFEDGAGLHFVDFGVGDAEAAAAVAEHRVGFGQFGSPAAHGFEVGTEAGGDFGEFLVAVRQEFVERGVEQADRDGEPGHDAEEVGEVLALEREELVEGGFAARGVGRHDHLADGADALGIEEHVFGAGQADAFGAELTGGLGVERGFGVGAYAHAADAVGPFHQGAEIAGEAGLDHRDGADEDLAGRAVEGDDLAGADGVAARHEGLGAVIDGDGAGAGDAGAAHAAGDDGGVAGHAAAGGDDALGGVHAVDVFGAGLDTDQDDGFALGGAHFGFVGVEDGGAAGRARAGGEAAGEQLAGGLGVQGGMEELVEACRADALDGFDLVDETGLGHFDGDAEAGGGGALAVASLQHVQLVLLHGELDVLHVEVVGLEFLSDGYEVGVGGREGLFHADLAGFGAKAGEGLGGADAGDDVLALGVDEEFAVENVLAGAGVAGEADAGGAVLAHVAEDHGLDVDGGAPGGGDVVQAAVGVGAGVHPGAEDGADGAPELLMGIHREGRAFLLLDHLFVFGDDLAPMVGRQSGVFVDAGVELGVLDDLLEAMMVDAEDDGAVHLDEAAIAVPGEAGVAACLFEPGDGGVVEAEVEHGVHHAGHGDAGAGADGDEEGLVGVAECQADMVLDGGEGGLDLVIEFAGVFVAVVVEGGADLGGDGEARRDREADGGHFGQVGALATEEVLHVGAAVIGVGAEAVDPFLHCLGRHIGIQPSI